MNRKPLIFSIGLLWGVLPGRALAGPDSLSAVVDAVVQRAPVLEAARAQVRQAQAARQEVSLTRLGRIDLSGSITRGNNPVYVFGSLLEQGRFGPQNFATAFLNDPPYLTNYKGSITAGVPVFTAFELSTQEKLAGLGKTQAESGQDLSAQQIRFQTLASYLQVIVSRRIGVMLDERIGSGSKAIEEAGQLKERGLVLGSDYFVAESIREGLKGWRIQVQGEETQALDRLAVLAGIVVPVPPLRFSETPLEIPSTETLIGQALESRPDLRIARLAAQSAEASRFQARSSLLPRASAFGNLQANTNDFTSAPSNALVGLQLDIPLGDPAYGPRRIRSQADFDARRRQADAAAETVRMDVAQAAQSYRTAVQSLAAARQTRDRAARALELFRPLYRSGRQSVMEVLRAEEGLARAEAGVQQALFGVHAGWAQLQWTIGRLDRDAVIQVESLLVEVK